MYDDRPYVLAQEINTVGVHTKTFLPILYGGQSWGIFQAWAGGRFDLYLESRTAPLPAGHIRPLLTLQDGVTYVHPASQRSSKREREGGHINVREWFIPANCYLHGPVLKTRAK